jgi:hypothetical protein
LRLDRRPVFDLLVILKMKFIIIELGAVDAIAEVG